MIRRSYDKDGCLGCPKQAGVQLRHVSREDVVVADTLKSLEAEEVVCSDGNGCSGNRVGPSGGTLRGHNHLLRGVAERRINDWMNGA
jgi:hypothetical protein